MKTMLLKDQLIADLNELGLKTMAGIVLSRAEEAAQKDLSYLEFLAGVVEAEKTTKHEKRTVSRRKAARLPFHKRLEQFDFSAQPSIDERRFRELSSLTFIDECHTIALLGPPGVGKTHLAVALAMMAIDAGYSTCFTTWSDLSETIKKALKKDQLAKVMSNYTRPKLLVVDESGYLPVDNATATQFFHIVSKRYGKGAMILTSNKGYRKWG